MTLLIQAPLLRPTILTLIPTQQCSSISDGGHIFFGTTTCGDQYLLTASTTVFDYSVIVWACCMLLPLIFYRRRALLPVFWRRFGCLKPGSGYLGLALMNAFFVCAFATKELVPYNALQADPSFILGLEPLQQPHGGTPRQPVHDADHGRFRASPPRLLWRHARLWCFALPPRCTPPLSIQDERFSKTQMTAHGVPCA
jgi:hypothetical protein